jgi:hypothetical protein
MYEHVGKTHKMNPSTEDVLFGGQLRDGMIVLIHDSSFLGEGPESGEWSHPYEEERYLTNNRWCRVTNFLPKLSHDPDIISFIGVYEDGTKQARSYHKSFAWYVKKGCLGQPLIMTEEEWADFNDNGPEDYSYETATSTQGDERPYTDVPFAPIFRAQIAYNMCGDDSGEDWCNTVCAWHQESGDIVDYQFLDCQVSAWGLAAVLFTIDVQLGNERTTWDDARDMVKEKVLSMIGDSDFLILGIGVTNFPQND